LSLGSLTATLADLKIVEIAIRNRGAVQYRNPSPDFREARFWIVRVGYNPIRNGRRRSRYNSNSAINQESKKGCAFFRSQFFSEFIVSGYPRIDQAFSIFATLWRQRKVNCSARLCFSLRHKPFLNHRLDGSVHDSSVETEKCGDLILIERGTAPEYRTNPRLPALDHSPALPLFYDQLWMRRHCGRREINTIVCSN
jgi:hypothetical protein